MPLRVSGGTDTVDCAALPSCAEIGRDRGATRPLQPIRKHLGDASLHKRSFERKKCAGAGLQEAAVTGQDCEVERRKLRIELPVRNRSRIS